MKAKLVHVEVPTELGTKDSSLQFYAALFGSGLARSLTDEVESHHIPISRDGTWMSVHVRSGEANAEHIVCHFAVDDLSAAVAELTRAGGVVVSDVVEVGLAERASAYYEHTLTEVNAPSVEAYDGSFFKSAYLRDPAGNLLALMEVDHASRIWFGLDATPTPAQMIGHSKSVAVGERFAAGESLS